MAGGADPRGRTARRRRLADRRRGRHTARAPVGHDDPHALAIGASTPGEEGCIRRRSGDRRRRRLRHRRRGRPLHDRAAAWGEAPTAASTAWWRASRGAVRGTSRPGTSALADVFSEARDISLCGVFEEDEAASNVLLVQHYRRPRDMPADYLPPTPVPGVHRRSRRRRLRPPGPTPEHDAVREWPRCWSCRRWPRSPSGRRSSRVATRPSPLCRRTR